MVLFIFFGLLLVATADSEEKENVPWEAIVGCITAVIFLIIFCACFIFYKPTINSWCANANQIPEVRVQPIAPAFSPQPDFRNPPSTNPLQTQRKDHESCENKVPSMIQQTLPSQSPAEQMPKGRKQSEIRQTSHANTNDLNAQKFTASKNFLLFF
uniref:Uncharacterized protein n=1 Tax=Panagrolaimus sp. PS1159 TaxID=55785 RepID=A0AC35F9G8_9BILA